MSSFLSSKFPSKSQWGQILKVLSKREKMVFFSLLFLFLASSLTLLLSLYLKNTEVVPAKGGSYTEGVLGSPRLINPLYAPASDVDRDLSQLIFAGLMKYNSQGQLISELAKEYQVLENGTVYQFQLKENILWQDKEPLTADDVVFTIKAIQNPSFKSPIRPNWLGVKVEKTADLTVRFELQNPSAVFLENCTVKIMPKHIWQEVSSQNFPLSIYNLKPVGSGPYKVTEISQDKEGNIRSLKLVLNPLYPGSLPSIEKLTFLFFDEEKELIKAFKSGKVQGFSLFSLESYQQLKKDDFLEYQLSLPRYFALFFNPGKSKVLAEKTIREALHWATNKGEIIQEVLLGKGKVVNSPILPEIYGFEAPTKIYAFDPQQAKDILEEAGYAAKEDGPRLKVVSKTPSFQFKSDLQLGSQGTEVQELQKCLAKYPDVYPEGEVTGYFGSKTKSAIIMFQEKYRAEVLEPYGLTAGTGKVLKGTRAKLNAICFPATEERLSLAFTLTTVDQPDLIKTANLLKEQWKEVGVYLEVEILDIATLEEEVIKPRDYEILLFGEVLTAIPDLYPFWHSSQVKDPGLNLASYENSQADKLLEGARQTLVEAERKEALEKFQEIFLNDIPALLLYNPDYLYLVSDKIKGIEAGIITDPSQRLASIENWYIKTKRAWK